MKTFPKPLTGEEEQAYLKRLEQGDPEARAVLIERNLRLIAHIIKKYNFPEREIEDMLSIGTVGLMKAVDTYRPGRGSKLATYAARCIENEVLMFLRANRRYRRDVSLFDPIGSDREGNEICIVDVVESGGRDALEDICLSDVTARLLRALPQILSEREYRILLMRYGLTGNAPLTQKEAADRMGISRSYVSRIEKRALAKCRAFLDGKG